MSFAKAVLLSLVSGGSEFQMDGAVTLKECRRSSVLAEG